MINNRYIKLILLFPCIYYLGCTKDSQSPPPPIPTVTLSAPSNIAVGESFTLDVNVANIDDLYAMSFEILFDRNYLEVLNGEQGFNAYPNDNIGPFSHLDTLGVLSVALGGDQINGEIFSATINTLQSGTTELELNEVNLLDDDGKNVNNLNSLIVRDAIITVISK